MALLPNTSFADFTLAKCGGGEIKGRGASFQNNAQLLFIDLFNGPQGCNGSTSVTPYESQSSGAGRAAFGEHANGVSPYKRADTIRYVAADEAPNNTQRTEMQIGEIDPNTQGDLNAADNGLLHVVPVAVGSVAIAVNYPDGCTLTDDRGTTTLGPGETAQTARLKIPAADLEKAMGAEFTTWGQLVPGLTGIAPKTDADCQAQPIRRIVRSDDSGTTFAFKLWLNARNEARNWDDAPLFSTPNTQWPRPNGAQPSVGQSVNLGGGQTCTSDLCASSSTGGGNLMTLLNATDGAIGYADLRTVKTAAGPFTFNPAAAPAAYDDKYWIPIQNTTTNAYVDPQSDSTAAGLTLNAFAGANCAGAVFSGVPTNSTGDWSRVTGANSPSGYTLCALTYMLVWDDYADVYGTSDAEQRIARTVKDYLDLILTDGVQGQLVSRDYNAVPNVTLPQRSDSLLSLARAAAADVNWRTGGGSAEPVATPAATATPAPSTTAVSTPVGTPVAPSNVFTVQGARVGSDKTITVTLQVPGRGTVAASAVTKTGVRAGSATAAPAAGGAVSLQIKPNAALKNALKKVKTSKKLAVTISIAFTPTGGSASTQTANVSIKGTKKPKPKKNKGKK